MNRMSCNELASCVTNVRIGTASKATEMLALISRASITAELQWAIESTVTIIALSKNFST